MSRQLELADGRRLCFAEYGVAHGHPVLYCHGFPASRLEARIIDGEARQRAVRVIAPDRPGYGGSDLWPDRTIADWARDAGALADTLEIERFSVLGVSGGGPYALACALGLAPRVRDVTIVCGLGPMTDFASTTGMGSVTRLLIGFAQLVPSLARVFNTYVTAPILALRPSMIIRILTATAPTADHEVLRRPEVQQTVRESFREAFRGGGRGVAWDLHLYTRDWGFSVDDIEQPVYLWHGEEDGTVPVEMGRRIAARLRDCRSCFLPNHGHFSLPIEEGARILATITDNHS